MTNSLNVYFMAESLLNSLYSSLSCSLLDRPCNKFVALGEPSSPCGDYLCVYLDQIPGSSTDLNDCVDGTDSARVEFSVKLVRNFNVLDNCSPTTVDVDRIKGLFADMSVLRSAMYRFVADMLDAGVIDGFDVGPIVPVNVGDDVEQFSTISGSVGLDMVVCDDGPCGIETLSPPERCSCDPIFEPDVPVNSNVVTSYE